MITPTKPRLRRRPVRRPRPRRLPPPKALPSEVTTTMRGIIARAWGIKFLDVCMFAGAALIIGTPPQPL